jgi:hypothetical protein
MSPESIPQISLGTAVLVIFATCAGLVMLRGMTRMLVGTLVLALSAWIGFIVWQKAPTLSFEWFGKPLGFITTGAPVAAFLGSFFLIRWIARAVASPFGEKTGPDPNRPRSVIGLAARLSLALIPTALICLIGAIIIHHTGSIAEIRAFASEKNASSEPVPAKRSQNLKDSVGRALPESWLGFFDPLADPARLSLAKAIAGRVNTPPEPVIDPATGKPIPRAIIVDDPELQNLAREGKFGTLLRHPLLTKAMEDPQVRKLLGIEDRGSQTVD